MARPLDGIRILEFAGIGPGPFACMMLADHGAEVIRIDRPGGVQAGPESAAETDILLRSRRRMEVDLKSEVGRAVIQRLAKTADGVVEGFRPGVMERLGLGPEVLMAENPKLVYGRMTGWGQTGPLSHAAGHDINYISLTGALHAFGRKSGGPVPPVNMVGDFGGGAMMLAYGMVAALLSAARTGEGTVIDAAMTDGSALLMAMIYSFLGQGSWQDRRGVNLLDTGAHFYDVYETSDGHHIAIGAIEPQFYAKLLDLTGLSEDPEMKDQLNPRAWDRLRERLGAVIGSRTRAEWDEISRGTDACMSPILSLTEAPDDPHNAARGTFVTAGGVVQPAPAPRYSSLETRPPEMATADTDTDAILSDLGLSPDEIAEVTGTGAVR